MVQNQAFPPPRFNKITVSGVTKESAMKGGRFLFLFQFLSFLMVAIEGFEMNPLLL